MAIQKGREGLLAIWLRPVYPDGDLACGPRYCPVLYTVHRLHRAFLPAMHRQERACQCTHDPDITDATRQAG